MPSRYIQQNLPALTAAFGSLIEGQLPHSQEHARLHSRI